MRYKHNLVIKCTVEFNGRKYDQDFIPIRMYCSPRCEIGGSWNLVYLQLWRIFVQQVSHLQFSFWQWYLKAERMNPFQPKSIFFYLGFFLTNIHESQDCRESLASQTLRHQPSDYCREFTSAHSCSRTRTGNLWFPSVSR